MSSLANSCVFQHLICKWHNFVIDTLSLSLQWPLISCFYFSAQTSGTTVTFVIIEGWVLTVASVGDSRGVLESAEGAIYYLSADHRLECSEEE